MAKSERPLDDDIRSCVDGLATRTRHSICAGTDAESPDQIQEHLDEAINAFRSEPVEAREARLATDAYRFGCLWGQTVCDRLGWEWAVVSLEPDDEFLGVVSPSRSHVVFPVDFLRDLLGDPDRDLTSLLLYNMLKAGRLPPASPGEYCVLG